MFTFFRCCTFLLYFNFYLSRNFFYINFLFLSMEMCPSHFFRCASTLISRFVCQSIFAIATSSLGCVYMCRPQCLPNNCKFLHLNLKFKRNRSVFRIWGDSQWKLTICRCTPWLFLLVAILNTFFGDIRAQVIGQWRFFVCNLQKNKISSKILQFFYAILQ